MSTSDPNKIPHLHVNPGGPGGLGNAQNPTTKTRSDPKKRQETRVTRTPPRVPHRTLPPHRARFLQPSPASSTSTIDPLWQSRNAAAYSSPGRKRRDQVDPDSEPRRGDRNQRGERVRYLRPNPPQFGNRWPRPSPNRRTRYKFLKDIDLGTRGLPKAAFSERADRSLAHFPHDEAVRLRLDSIKRTAAIAKPAATIGSGTVCGLWVGKPMP